MESQGHKNKMDLPPPKLISVIEESETNRC